MINCKQLCLWIRAIPWYLSNDFVFVDALDNGIRTFIVADSVRVTFEAYINLVFLSDDYHGDSIVAIDTCRNLYLNATSGAITYADATLVITIMRLVLAMPAVSNAHLVMSNVIFYYVYTELNI